jgi:hypothetical protein
MVFMETLALGIVAYYFSRFLMYLICVSKGNHQMNKRRTKIKKYSGNR